MKRIRPVLQCVALILTACFGVAYSAKADNIVSYQTTIYYVGPSADGSDNPFGLNNDVNTGDPIGTFNGGITSTGSLETVTFDSGGDPSVSIEGGTTPSPSTGAFTVLLYGPDPQPGYSSGPLVSISNTLVPGTYLFDSCYDYFGINDTGTYHYGGACPYDPPYVSYINCFGDQLCNSSNDPVNITTINVSSNGVVTILNSSFEAAFSEPTVDVTPELSTWILWGTGLLGVGFVLRRRRLASSSR